MLTKVDFTEEDETRLKAENFRGWPKGVREFDDISRSRSGTQ